MPSSMMPLLSTIAGAAAAVALNALWEGALLVVSVWLLLRAWPHLNAATRYTVWSATLAAAVVLPLATTLPFIATPPAAASPTTTSPSIASTAGGPAVRAPMVTHALSAGHGQVRDTVSPTTSSASPSMPRLPDRLRLSLPLPLSLAILAAWAVLAVLFVLRLGIGLMRLEQLKRDALPLPVEYRDAMPRWEQANKGSRPVRLCVSDDIDVPVAVGLFDSMILIPRALIERLSPPEVDQITLHELAHLRRADDWTNALQRVAIALFAWNPALQFVGQQLDLEREVACDDYVLSFTGLVRPYALCLTKMAETSQWPRQTIPAPGVFATRKHISLRIERLLGAGRNVATRLSFAPTAAAVAVVAALAFVMQLVAPSIAAPAATTVSDQTTEHHQIVVIREISGSPSPGFPAPLASPQALPAPQAAAQPSPGPAKAAPAATPQVRVVIPPFHVAMPPVHLAVPGPKISMVPTIPLTPRAPSTIHVPAMHVHVPATTVSVPAIDVDVPERTMAFPTVAQNVSNCAGCNFRRVDWSGRSMRGVRLTGADLTGANLHGTDFGGANLAGTSMSRADLSGASFKNANLVGVDFTGANLTGADFTGAKIGNADFSHANLSAATLRSAVGACTGCDFSGANLAGADLSGLRVSSNDFSHANLRNANLSNAVFTGTDFTGATLDGANLNGTTINGCDLSGVDLSRVDVSKTHFVGVDFSKQP